MVKIINIAKLNDDIITACKKNDRLAQESLYKYFLKKMLPWLKSYTTNEDDLISIFNDGMLRVFTKINTFTGQGEFEGWVFKIIQNSLFNYHRKNGQELEFFELQEFDESQSPGIFKKLFYDDLVDLLKDLPEQTLKVFRMFAIEGYSHKEIAEILGISVGTSKWHVFKAREKLNVMRNFEIEKYG
ncbi:MAG: sigma-70 family RNA polymerase sigma factor [Saprospiraceae bacterium]